MNYDEQPLAFRIKSLSNQIKRLLERTAIEQNDANLTGMQYAILGFLGEQEESANIYQRDIEAEFNIRRSTASGILKLLEKQGLIQRTHDAVDSRLKKIILTEKAKELDKIARANLDQLQVRLTRNIPPREMEQFFRTLKKISDNAQE